MLSDSMVLPQVGLVRERVVLAHVGCGRTKWRSLVASGSAPAPQKLSERISVYDAGAIRVWIADRARGVPLLCANFAQTSDEARDMAARDRRAVP